MGCRAGSTRRVDRRVRTRSRGGEMETGSGRAIEIAPFHSRGTLRGFVVSGRWPDSTKEWAQVLRVAVRVASFPGLLSTTTIFGAREELPDSPEPGTVGLVVAEGTVVGENAVPPGHFADHQPPALLMLHPPSETTPVAARMLRCRLWLRPAAGTSTPGSRPPCRVGGGRVRRNGHLDGQSRRHRSDQRSRYGDPGHAAGRLTPARWDRRPPLESWPGTTKLNAGNSVLESRPRSVGTGIRERHEFSKHRYPLRRPLRWLPADPLACEKTMVGSL